MEVKVFGVEGCSSCDRLFRTLQHIAAELGNVQVDKENDLGVALTYGLRVPPRDCHRWGTGSQGAVPR